MKVIVGLGISGLSCARYFERNQIPFQVIDTRDNPPLLAEFHTAFPNTPLFLGSMHEAILRAADEIIISPGMSPHTPLFQDLKAAGINLIGDIELFARQAKAKVIGITGSNAKGTVTTLVGEMIKEANMNVLVGGNIGIPILDLLVEPVPDVYVLELSSFQLETTYSLKLHAATILNISPDHLDRHENMENYTAAKQRIYEQCEYAIYNADDQATYPQYATPNSISFGLNDDAAFSIVSEANQTYFAQNKKTLLPTTALKIYGKHNWLNALAALALGSTLNLPLKAMLSALTKFPGLPHRCQWIGELHGIAWYDDSKGTNVGATQAALEGLGPTLKGKIVLIAGGLGKGADFHVLRDAVSRYVKTIILLGQDAPLLADALKGCCDLLHVKTLPEAVNTAEKIATGKDVVLLSPACASLDMFKDYHHRGEVFVESFRALTKG